MKPSTAVAVVAAIVAVLAVLFPGLGFGQPDSFRGGVPSHVFATRAEAPEACAPIGVNVDGVQVMPLQVQVGVPSHLYVTFSFKLSQMAAHEVVQVNPNLVGVDGPDFNPNFARDATLRTVSETVTQFFPNVAPGTHTVDVFASVFQVGPRDEGPLQVDMEDCVLTVFVTPVAP